MHEFIDPDELVLELRDEQKKAEEEEIIYVDEYGNEIKDYDPNAEANKGQFVQGGAEDEDEDLDSPTLNPIHADMSASSDAFDDGTLTGDEDVPQDDVMEDLNKDEE